MARPRTLIAVTAPRLRADIARAGAGCAEIVDALGSPEALIERIDDTIDLVIADAAVLGALARHYRRSGQPGRRPRPAVILTIADDELRDALGLLGLCHGILFWQHDLDKLSHLIVITLEGYCGIPSERLPDLLSNRLRISLIERLLPLERATLRLLSEALTNRAIASRLGIAEPAAKSLVRSVLTKLCLKNRTEAAVFAVRWRDTGYGDLDTDAAAQPGGTAQAAL